MIRLCASDIIKMRKEALDDPFIQWNTGGINFDDLEAHYEKLDREELEEYLKNQRPHISAFLTWEEVWQIGSEKAALGVDADFYGQKQKVRRPLAAVKYLLNRKEVEEFKAWLEDTEPRYAAQREKEREEERKRLRQEYRKEVEAEGGRWWNVI